ncbi:calpain-12 isoform X2 [Micropterus salmoides]|uniref:calpain-12 isoform X2 n=1 Tax=Micropterus salmoides TaxID=27706 RepID=UPI0018ED41B1|nr:calpain-12 isoform X2 [Micropterus salmoides]
MDDKVSEIKEAVGTVPLLQLQLTVAPGAPHTFRGRAEPGRRFNWGPYWLSMATDAASLGSIENPIRFKDQDFDTILEECLKSGKLFADPTFLPEQKSIGMPEDPDPKKATKWQRPKEISKNAVFVDDTTGTTDICQGQLGDCWLLAALSCLTMHPTLFAKVVPPNQSMSEPYAGIFHFRFWQYGVWVEVVVDDRLPVRQGRLLFSYSETRNEYWSALVEKAYAKLVGCYGSLKGGNISEAMEDFTGGIAYSMKVSSRTPRALWRSLTAAVSRGSLLSCFIQACNNLEIGKVTGDGLIKGHAYAITDTHKVTKASEEMFLLKLRNPWGFGEYCGPWSDKGKEWDDVDKAEKEMIHLKNKDDGEFWISIENFCSVFNVVEHCSVNPDTLEEENTPDSPSSIWTISEHQGFWVPSSSADSFWKNPQFQLVLTEHDDSHKDNDDDNSNYNEYDEEDEIDDNEDDEDDKLMASEEKMAPEKPKRKGKRCTVLVELLQKNRRQKDKINFLYIAFHIYKVPSELQGVCLNRNFFMKNRPVGRSGKYVAQRGVWRKLRLEPGNYMIVASTFKPNQPGDFFVRIFSKTGNTLETQDFTCTSGYLPVMGSPISVDDRERVQRTFDEQAGPDDRLNAKELMNLFNSVLNKDYHLPLETCRQLIFGEDTTGRSSLTREQTEALLSSLRNLQAMFLKFDEDSSGTMSPFELSTALEAVGMQCDGKVVQLLSARFAAGELQMPFHGFVSCVTRLRMLFALYKSETIHEVKDRGINQWLLQFLLV